MTECLCLRMSGTGMVTYCRADEVLTGESRSGNCRADERTGNRCEDGDGHAR